MLKIYNAADIEDANLSPPQMIVPGLLPVGLTGVGGSPKTGKSWLILNLAYAVATGGMFLNHPTVYGDCLYIDLEGSQYRIKERMDTLNYSFPRELQITHEAPALNEGLLDELESWWACANFPRMIIIDTVGRLKSAGNKTMNAYENDSRMFAPLQTFALSKKIAVVLVTHLKKETPFRSGDIDWVERISGSMGLVGCCDAVWGLFRKRSENKGILRTTARDVDAGDIVCEFDNGAWKYVSDDVDQYEFNHNPLVRFLADLSSFNGRADELCDAYLTYCREKGVPHGLSDKQPTNSFGKQIKPIINQGWRFNHSISRERKKDSIYYHIETI